jgi:hypothetical protein
MAAQWRSEFPATLDEELEAALGRGGLVSVLVKLWRTWPAPPSPLQTRERAEQGIAEVLGEMQVCSGGLVPLEWLAIAPRLEQGPEIPVEATEITVATLGWLYEQCLGNPVFAQKKQGTRKANGVYYTPTTMIDRMVQDTVGSQLQGQGTLPDDFCVLDPACGSGAFLLVVYEFLLRRYAVTDLEKRQQVAVRHLFGVDLDGDAVAIARLSLWLKSLQGSSAIRPLPELKETVCQGNALFRRDPPSVPPWQGGKPGSLPLPRGGLGRGERFDVVLGNPPYIDSEAMAVHWPELRHYCRQHYATATGNWDLFCVFVERSLELCRPGGLVSLVVPNKLVSADYAATVRSLLTRSHKLLKIYDYSRCTSFAAAVYPVVFLVQKQLPDPAHSIECQQITNENPIIHALPYATLADSPETPWLLTNPNLLALMRRLSQDFPKLEAVAEIYGAATVGEAYRLQAILQDCPHAEPGDLKLVNSGTIDRYRLLWGEKSCRYLGCRLRYPVVSKQARTHLPTRRLTQAQQPKIIVAGMTRHLECAGDFQGNYLAGKSTSIITSKFNLSYLLGILNSRLLSLYLKTMFQGNQLQGGYLRIGPPQLKLLPIQNPDVLRLEERRVYDRLVNQVEKLRALYQVDSPVNATLIYSLEADIERLVNHLYGITQKEQQLIEHIEMLQNTK